MPGEMERSPENERLLHEALRISSRALAAGLIERRATLALAESCTGGLVAAVLTEIPGAGEWFEGALVTYSNTAKERLLHVPHDMLEQHGAVSKEVALAMASGVLGVTCARWAGAVTGLAGPDGGTAAKPVGTVWLAWQARGEPGETACHLFHGTRQEVRFQSARTLIDGLRHRLKG
jgi:nicotinamide-nucleotide amidase